MHSPKMRLFDQSKDVRHEIDRFGDHPPRLVIDADGFAQLFVTPNSRQSELMVRANAIVAERILQRIQKLEKAFSAAAGDSQPTMPNEFFTLSNEFAELTRFNARLRGREPYTPRRPEAPAPSDLYRPKLLDRLVGALVARVVNKPVSPADRETTLYTPYMTGSHFQGSEVGTLLNNLELAAGDLNEQTQRLRISATQTLPLEAQTFTDRAWRLHNEAADMMALQSTTFKTATINHSPAAL